MTHLNIIQNPNTVEQVSNRVIEKLYETAVNIPEPLSGQTDEVNLEGFIETYAAYEEQVKYLAGNIKFRGSISINHLGRCPNFTISITQGYAIDIADPVVREILVTNYGNGEVITSNDLHSVPTQFRSNNHITSFNEMSKFPITYINNYSFAYSSIRSIDTSRLVSIDRYAFTSCPITTLVIPSVVSIPTDWSFKIHDNIRTLDFGSSLITIGSYAFWDSSITTLIFRGDDPPTYELGVGPNSTRNSTQFKYNNNNLKIYVPGGRIGTYRNAWPDMAGIIYSLEDSEFATPGYSRQ